MSTHCWADNSTKSAPRCQDVDDCDEEIHATVSHVYTHILDGNEFFRWKSCGSIDQVNVRLIIIIIFITIIELSLIIRDYRSCIWWCSKFWRYWNGIWKNLLHDGFLLPLELQYCSTAAKRVFISAEILHDFTIPAGVPKHLIPGNSIGFLPGVTLIWSSFLLRKLRLIHSFIHSFIHYTNIIIASLA